MSVHLIPLVFPSKTLTLSTFINFIVHLQPHGTSATLFFSAVSLTATFSVTLVASSASHFYF